jgi:hypothetical protein
MVMNDIERAEALGSAMQFALDVLIEEARFNATGDPERARTALIKANYLAQRMSLAGIELPIRDLIEAREINGPESVPDRQ